MPSPRRIRWAMRAAVYLPLAVLALVVLGMRGPDESINVLEGDTTQSGFVAIDLDPQGAPVAFSTRFDLQCSWGESHELAWTGRAGTTGVRFRRDGDGLEIRDTWETPVDGGWRLEGSVVLDGRVGARSGDGVVSAELRYTRGGHRHVCRAARVGWTARER